MINKQQVRRVCSISLRKIQRSINFTKTHATHLYTLGRRTLHHAGKHPHSHLTSKFGWYRNWHEWKHHKKAHVSVLASYCLAVMAVLLTTFSSSFAATIASTWDFSVPSQYAFDANTVETTGTSGRLKAQNYQNDAQTGALYHFDESTGTSVADSSSHANTGTLHADSVFTTGILNNGLRLDGNQDYMEAPDSPSLSLTGAHTLEAWTKFDTTFNTDADQDQGVIDKGSYKIYYDRTSGKINYEIANGAANTWSRQAGGDTNGSWDADGKTIVRSTLVDGVNQYIGLGLGTGDAEVWRWNGTSWAQIGGDGVNSSWADQTFEDVNALVKSGNYLYAGLGTNLAGDAEVWRCDVTTHCADWDKIGGDAVNGSWAVNTFEAVHSLMSVGGDIYAGLGASTNDAEVWMYNGTSWSKIGGDGVNSSWSASYESVRSLTSDGINVYAGVGDTATDAEVWMYNGTSWSKIGGDGVNSSWAAADNVEYVTNLDYFGGKLYAGTGLTAGDADVWMYNGTSWSKIGGDGVNSSWASSTYELVGALVDDGTSLYAGVGNGNGEGEVYRWSGSSWSKIGGDGVNSSFSTNQGDGVYALSYGSGKLVAGVYDAGGGGTSWEYDGSSWTMTGGGYVNGSWGFYGLQSVEVSTTLNEKLYVGTGVTVAGNAMVWEFNGSTWQLVGGQGLRGSWAADTFESVLALQVYKGQLYAALGSSANDAEVWRYDGSTWTKVGGDGANSGWTVNYEAANTLAVYDGYLYAGLGNTANDSEVWRYDGSTWTKVGGDGVNSSWATGVNIERVMTMTVFDGQLYAGLGTTTGDAEVWRYDGSTWTKVGGDGIASSWNTSYEEVTIMRVFDGKLIVGLGSGAGNAGVWRYDGSTWTQVGGAEINDSWTSGTYERVRAMGVYNGELYVGVGDSAGDGEVWRYDGSTWTQVGGDGMNNSWSSGVEYVSTLIDYRGKLYAGTGYSGNVDAAVWSYGNNAFLSSARTSQDTNWHHVAATYNGSSMKLYIDGVEDSSTSATVAIPDNSLPLYIGSKRGSGGAGEGQGFFKGVIDEVRISNSARPGFTIKPFSTTKQTVSLANAAFTNGVKAYESFDAIETLNGGSIAYRLSDDNGATWQYWTGSAWAQSTTLDDANTKADVNAHIADFPVTFGGLKWQAVLSSNGNQRVTLNSVTIHADSDDVAPDANATNIAMKKSATGSAVASNGWTNGASPYFSWDAGNDAESGVLGYCLYLGQDNTANPATTKGILGTSPTAPGGNCQFLVDSASVDLAGSGLLDSAMATSMTPYYLRVRAIDRAGNLYPTSEQFQFRFDNTPPTNPGFISAPSGFINTKEATLTWPTTGGQAAADGASGVAGLQYRIENTPWYGDSHDGTGSSSDLLANDGTYTTIPTPDFDNLNDGTSTVYFRTWDQAGNSTSSYVSAALKINTNGSPSEPQNASATPSSSSTNNFSFHWDAPTSYVGSENTLNYCYTINVAPSAATCSYTGAGITSLSAGPYATQTGVNTLYVVARDESNNINYGSYATTVFTANTTAPGIPVNVDIVDVSIKATSKWRLAIAWDIPTSTGDGIAAYKVYRSGDGGASYSAVGTSSSTTYIDAGLTQKEYKYKVAACDSTNNCSAMSAMVAMTPTGKFTEPANLIGEPIVSNVTTKRADVSWTTDRPSDSKIAIGTSSGKYGEAEIGNSDQLSVHDISLENLAAGTTYYYVVKWTDVDGNTGVSQEQSFTTSPAPLLKEINTTRIGLSDAVIGFTSVNAIQVNLYYGESQSFGGLKSVNTSASESQYSVDLNGLKDGTKYYYQIGAFDNEGAEYKGNVFSFTTPPRPRIANLDFQPVPGEPTSTQSVTWTTNVPSTSTIVYGKVGTSGIEIQNSEMKTEHVIKIANLEDDSEYFLLAQSRDSSGNLAVSDRQVFRTALDTRAPKVSDITIESSIRGSGSEARGQVIVSWKTDEPATSQVGYAEGSAATVFNSKTAEDEQLTTEHIVVLSNLPTSKVYSIQPISYDKSRNIATGKPQPSIIGRANESALTVVLNALQRIFGL